MFIFREKDLAGVWCSCGTEICVHPNKGREGVEPSASVAAAVFFLSPEEAFCSSADKGRVSVPERLPEVAESTAREQICGI